MWSKKELREKLGETSRKKNSDETWKENSEKKNSMKENSERKINAIRKTVEGLMKQLKEETMR